MLFLFLSLLFKQIKASIILKIVEDQHYPEEHFPYNVLLYALRKIVIKATICTEHCCIKKTIKST